MYFVKLKNNQLRNKMEICLSVHFSYLMKKWYVQVS